MEVENTIEKEQKELVDCHIAYYFATVALNVLNRAGVRIDKDEYCYTISVYEYTTHHAESKFFGKELPPVETFSYENANHQNIKEAIELWDTSIHTNPSIKLTGVPVKNGALLPSVNRICVWNCTQFPESVNKLLALMYLTYCQHDETHIFLDKAAYKHLLEEFIEYGATDLKKEYAQHKSRVKQIVVAFLHTFPR